MNISQYEARLDIRGWTAMETDAGAESGQWRRRNDDYSDAAHYPHTDSEIGDNMSPQRPLRRMRNACRFSPHADNSHRPRRWVSSNPCFCKRWQRLTIMQYSLDLCGFRPRLLAPTPSEETAPRGQERSA